nr:hypothetical protein BaRGS_001491 [Batillaria attramentaria]
MALQWLTTTTSRTHMLAQNQNKEQLTEASWLRNEEAQRERELRRQQIADRRAANEAAQKEILDWESNTLLAEPNKSHMMHSWELPQIGLFLYLLRDPLNLGEIPQFELERCLAMSRQSTTLQLIMTSLLSTPFQRLKIDKKTLMPYSVWTFKLTKKLDVWYKALNDCQGDKNQAAIKLGLDARSFDVMGTRNPLRRRPFHKHSFYRKVWILKSLCDYCLETQESLRKFLEDNQPIEDQRELVLGSDAKGNVYIHFPQFCGADLRIYRQRKPQAPESSDEEEEETESENSKASSAKRQLKLGNQGSKSGRSSTPSKDSESESVPSPAPSSSKSRSQSRNSSPMPRESSGRTRQSASRNTPSPHSTSQDSIFGLLPSGSKARKTRNSAEASLLYSIMDLSAIGRRRSRRGKAAVASDVENQDTESSCSNIGEENSQDGLPSFSSALVSNNPHKQDCGDAGDGNKSDKLNSAVPVKSEFDSIYSNSSPVSVKEEPGDGGSHCDNSSLTSNTEYVATSHSRNARDSSSRSPQIRTEQNGAAEHDVTKTPVDLPTDDTKEVKKESLSCDNSTESSDEQKPSILTVQVSSASESTQRDVAHLDPGSGCDGAFTQKSSGENSKIDSEAPQPTSAHFSSTQESNSKADDSGFVSVGCAKDSDEDACSDNQNGSSEDVKASVQAALIDHAAYSAATVKSKAAKSRVKEEIIMEESDEEEEEMEPDLEEFELIADSVKGLQDIVNQFADPVPPAADGGSSRKGKKQRVWKPPQRKRCEVELRQRLTSMLNELTKWEQKLVQAAARMRTKMRREFDEYKEELPKEEDTEAWDTEPEADSSDEEGNEDSQTGEDGEESEESQTGTLLAAAKKKKGPSSTPSTASETTEVDRRDVEDYEMDVSSRGRLRKRRVIPNNIEDQGIKKKKVTKKPDGNETPVTTAHMPNILQKSQPGKQVAYSYTFSPSGLGDSSALLASLTRQGGTGVLSLSASQLLAMAVSQGPAAAGSTTVTGTVKGQQQQGLVLTPQGLVLKTTQASSQVSAPGAGSTGQPSSGSAKLNSHPEIQKLLSARRPLVVDSRHAPYKTVQLRETGSTGAQKGLAAAAVSTNPTASPSSSVPSAAVAVGQAHQPPGAKGAGTTTTGAGATSSAQRSGTMMLAMVGGKPQLVPASLVQQLMKAGTLRIQATTTAAAAGVTNSAPISSQSGTNHPAGIAIRPASRPQGTPQVAATQVAQTVRPGTVTQSLNRMQLNSLVLKPATPGQVTSLGQVVPPARIQGVAGVVGGVGGVAVTSSGMTVSPTSLAQVAVIGSPGKQLQRYAGNVTVKTLLENRAARKSSEDGESSQTVEGVPQSTTPSSPPKNSDVPSLSVTNSPPASRTTLGVVPTAGLMARGVGVPGVVRLSSQSMLDLAVQTVVTSYHTTLPTADIKVPSPTTLPSLSPKKNVTSVVMSTKAPIPITTRCESTSSSSALTKSAGLAAVAGGASLTAVVQGSDAAKPGVVLMTGGKDLDPNNKNKVVLQVVPQGGVGSQTIVQASVDQNAAAVIRGRVKVGASMPAAALVQQMAAIRGVQNPRIISTQVAGAQQRAAAQVQVPLGQLDGQQKQDQVSSPKGKADVGSVGAKRSSDTSVQPIPVKMARWDAPSNLSGPVLASLSQVVGAKMNKNPGHVKGNGVAKTVPNSIANSALGQLGGLSETDSQPAVMTQAEDPQNNVEAGFTSLGSVSTGSVVTDAAGTVSPNHTGRTIQAQINVAQWLQQMQQTSAASVVTTSAQPTVQQIQGTDQQQLLQQLQQQQQHQQQQQQQQPVVMMRTVGGQLLTPLNIPVTVNNGVMKESGDAFTHNGNTVHTGDGNDGVVSGGPDNLIEKEQAALSLLTFANQVPTD